MRGSYSSKKVGRTIQFESHTVELPALISFYDYDDDALVYLVFGVNGVGKTRLMQEFQKRLLKHFLDELLENPGSLIVGGIEVDSAEGGKFNHSDYYIQVLESLREVLIGYKIYYGIDNTEPTSADALLGTFESKNSKALRRAMQKVFIHRQLKAYTLDEAQHQSQLVDICPNCGSSLKVIANSSQLGFCYRCKAWLGSKSEHQALLIDDFESELQIITGITVLEEIFSSIECYFVQ